MEKQTAVEWLIEQLQAPCRGIPSHIIEQAKQLEKDQQFGFFVAGIDATEEGGKDFEQYYSNTFKTK